MSVPLIVLLVALLFFFGPFRRNSWRRGGWDSRRDFDSWRRDRQALDTEREERDRRREEHIESLESRVSELESRLDYAERLLTQRRESPALGVVPPASHA